MSLDLRCLPIAANEGSPVCYVSANYMQHAFYEHPFISKELN